MMNTLNETKLDFVSWIERVIAAEAEARVDYYDLLRLFSESFTDEEILQVKEIIAEELKHTEILRKIAERTTNIVPEA